MRVLFTVSSWPTHYAAMVPLGWALQALGHDVRVLCPPSQRGPLGAAGLTAVPVLAGLDIVVANRLQYHWEARNGLWPYPWLPPHPLTGERMGGLADFDVEAYRRDVEPGLVAAESVGFDAAVDLARRWSPHLVLHDPTSLEGLLAARVTGVPALLCLWGPVGTHEEPWLHIVPPDRGGAFRRHGVGDFDLGMIRRVVDPCPAAVAPATEAVRVPVGYVPYNGPGDVPAWLFDPPARPRVVIAWSTALSTMCGPDSYLLPDLVAALAGLDAEIVLTATAADVAALDRAGGVPAAVRVCEQVPLRLLLPGCAAVVHHGGSGNAMTSFRAGVPQLAVTFSSEAAVTGRRIAAAGAGHHLPGHLADRAAVRAAVADLLTGGDARRRAADLRGEILRRPTAADVVRTLCELAASG